MRAQSSSESAATAACSHVARHTRIPVISRSMLTQGYSAALRNTVQHSDLLHLQNSCRRIAGELSCTQKMWSQLICLAGRSGSPAESAAC
jgi:hypothetical protein